MFREYVDFEDALSCYEHLLSRKKDQPDALRTLTSNFRMYAKLRAERSNDTLAKGWIVKNDTIGFLANPPQDIGTQEEQDILEEFLSPSSTDKDVIKDTASILKMHREKIDSMLGLVETKKQIDDLVSYMKVVSLRKAAGFTQPSLSMHMAFLGNPGTGKTSIAREMSGILYGMGVARSSKLIEVDRGDLIGSKIGMTEEKTREIFESARGGTLFIDEAHTLLQPYCQLDFGRECTDLLCKLMEDYRDDTTVILAGYTSEMKKTILAHKGIESRIGHIVNFPDYSPAECVSIFEKLCADNQYVLTEGASLKFQSYCQSANPDGLGENVNARHVRNIFEKSLIQQAKRLSSLKKPSKTKLRELRSEDITLPNHRKTGKIVYLKG